MENNEKLKGIILAHIKSEKGLSLPFKKFNEKKFLESDFLDRYIDFLKDFNMVFFDKSSFELSEIDNKIYEDIILRLYHVDHDYSPRTFPFSISIRDFISMDHDKIIAYQKRCAKYYTLIYKANALYNEFVKFYE